jgi:hypothetical protein
MPRAISIGSALVALVFLVLVLADATLVDRRPPSVTEVRLSATAGGDRIAEPIASINVVFSEAVRKPTAEERFHVEPNVTGALTWDGTTLIFTPSEPLAAATDFLVRVDPGFVDLAGNAATAGVDEWTFATAGPPRVIAVTPNDGSLGLATDASVALEFDRLMDPTTVEAAITFEPAISFEAAWSGETLTLSFPDGLAFGTNYRLEVGLGASDTAGANLTAPFVTRFSTVSAGLTARVVPAEDVAGIAVRSPIAVLFDGPIDPSSIDGALTITPSLSGGLQIQTPPGGATDSALVFTPSGPLAEHTTYAVTLAPVVHRLGDPAEVAAGRTWSFTTGAATQSAQNQIAFLSERSGVRNVWLVNADGTNARQVTWELAPVTGFDVTGDGRRLVFAAGGVIGSVDVSGANRQVLTDTGTFELAPRLTPDETALIFSRLDAAGTDAGWWLRPTPWTFGDERQVLVSGALTAADVPTDPFSPPYQPAFDPTGLQVLVPTQAGDLVLVDLSTAVSTSRAVLRVPSAAPLWSESTNGFVVPATTAVEGGDVAVFRIGLDGSAAPIGGTEGAHGSLAIDENGQMLYGLDHLALFNPGSGTATRVTTDGRYVEGAATFSPDGQKAVVSRVTRGSPELAAGLWLVDLTSRSLTQLTLDGSDPRWLP